MPLLAAGLNDIDTAIGEFEIDGETEIIRAYLRMFERHFEKQYTSTQIPDVRGYMTLMRAIDGGPLDAATRSARFADRLSAAPSAR